MKLHTNPDKLASRMKLAGPSGVKKKKMGVHDAWRERVIRPPPPKHLQTVIFNSVSVCLHGKPSIERCALSGTLHLCQGVQV